MSKTTLVGTLFHHLTDKVLGSQRVPAVVPVDPVTGDALSGVLKTIVDSATSGTVYTCEAPPGTATSAAGWRISREVTADSVVTKTWAGTGTFDQIADNRASLTYV